MHQSRNKLLLQEDVAMAVFAWLNLTQEDSIRPYTPTSFICANANADAEFSSLSYIENPPKRELMNDNCAIFSAAYLAFSICHVLVLRHRLFLNFYIQFLGTLGG